jgi:hypothetical protein
VIYSITEMSLAEITIAVDPETAAAFAKASPEQQRKLRLLLNLRLRELTVRPSRPLSQIMDEIGEEAARNGMTPEILESILNEK